MLISTEDIYMNSMLVRSLIGTFEDYHMGLILFHYVNEFMDIDLRLGSILYDDTYYGSLKIGYDE